MSLRTPPVSEIFALHRPKQRGKCLWCGLPCDERTPVRKLLRYMHYACSDEVAVIQSPEAARIAVFKRDRGICVECGGNFSEKNRFRPRWPFGHQWHVDFVNWNGWSAMPGQHRFAFVHLIAISMWHVDHKVPLWKAAHLPPEKRIAFFKLDALVTLCETCHERKTAKEAGARAHFKRLSDTRAKEAATELPARAPGRLRGRKIPSRPFPKVHRPMRRGA